MKNEMMLKINVAALIAACWTVAAWGMTGCPDEGLIWSDKPTRVWTDAYPVGNGLMGAMVFGDAPVTRLQFNHMGLWTQAPNCNDIPDGTGLLDEMRRAILHGNRKNADAPSKKFLNRHTQASYQPFGDLRLSFAVGAVTNLVRRLSIESGLASSAFESGGVAYEQETFAAYFQPELIVHTVKASRPGAISCEVSLTTPHASSKVSAAAPDTLGFSGRVALVEGFTNAVSFAAQAKIVPTGARAKLEIRDGIAHVTNADALEIRLTGATNRRDWKTLAGDPVSDCARQLAQAACRGTAEMREATAKHFSHRYNWTRLEIDSDPELAKLPTAERLARQSKAQDAAFASLVFAYGRYLMIASSRPGGEPITLQGLWNDSLKPPWASKYTCNINNEMNYWPAEPTGLPECHESLFRALPELMESGRRTARAYYGCRGWVLHHNYDVWRSAAPTDGPQWGLWPMGGAWLSLHLWEHYLFCPSDIAFLRDRAWPVMSEAARFFTDYLVRHPKTGHLVTCPSMSPEHGGLRAAPAMDMQIIRALYAATLEAAKILGKDTDADNCGDSLVRDVRAQLPELEPNHIGRWGQLQEWMEDEDREDDRHRHISHLWAVYPGSEINWQTPKFFAAAKKSLIARGDEANGWSMGWKINFWARFRDGDHALKIMDNLFRPASKGGAGLYDNLFDACPPFQIDGNFGATAGIAEMLMQSHLRDEKGRVIIDLLPALPTAWIRHGSMSHLRTRGGYDVSFEWKDGKVVKIALESKCGDKTWPAIIRLGDEYVVPELEEGKWKYAIDRDGPR